MKKKKDRKADVKKVEVLRIIEITPGGNSAWVETNVGKMKKPLKGIPLEVVDEFEARKGADE